MNQLLELLRLSLNADQRVSIRVQKPSIPAEQVSAKSRLQIECQLLKFVGFGDHTVGVFHRGRDRFEPFHLPDKQDSNH